VPWRVDDERILGTAGIGERNGATLPCVLIVAMDVSLAL
jgi:hypothetical protein